MAARSPDSDQIVRQARSITGHDFKDPDRLIRALTHASARGVGGTDYERLEFLGDRVLGLIVSEMLFDMFPKAAEGEMSVRLNQLVDADTCAEITEEIGLHELILTGSEIKTAAGRKRRSLRADVMESLIATMYLDGGLDAVRPFIRKHWMERMKADGAGRADPKTALQEWSHRFAGPPPTYEVISRKGPDHDPIFTVEVSVEGAGSKRGRGNSKRDAEREAATAMLEANGVWKASATGSD